MNWQLIKLLFWKVRTYLFIFHTSCHPFTFTEGLAHIPAATYVDAGSILNRAKSETKMTDNMHTPNLSYGQFRILRSCCEATHNDITWIISIKSNMLQNEQTFTLLSMNGEAIQSERSWPLYD